MTGEPPGSSDRRTDLPPAPVAVLMYPAAEVEARIKRLEATITRLEGELADALERAKGAERAAWQATAPEAEEHAASAAVPAAAPAPEPAGDFLDHFLGALHDPVPADPSPSDGQEGNSR